MVFIALAWIPVIKNAQGLYNYLQAVQGYLAPPIFVVFFFGVFFKRLNAQGCLWAMIVGFALGLFRMAVDTPVTLGLTGFERFYTEGSFLWVVNNIYFQYFSVDHDRVGLLMVAVSHMTAEPDYSKLQSDLETLTKNQAHTSQLIGVWALRRWFWFVFWALLVFQADQTGTETLRSVRSCRITTLDSVGSLNPPLYGGGFAAMQLVTLTEQCLRWRRSIVADWQCRCSIRLHSGWC